MSKTKKATNEDVVAMFHELRHASDAASAIEVISEKSEYNLAYVIGTLEEAADFIQDVDTGRGMIRELRDIIKGWRERAEAAEARLVSSNPFQWQPIETAPRDGKFLLGAYYNKKDSEWEIDMMCWQEYGTGHAEWISHGTTSIHWEPSHWMPMPMPPGAQGDRH